ncbi:MAG: hypothetical protein AB1646_09130 [Thermodesulfobacteriota bacterium]
MTRGGQQPKPDLPRKADADSVVSSAGAGRTPEPRAYPEVSTGTESLDPASSRSPPEEGVLKGSLPPEKEGSASVAQEADG